MFDSLLLLAKGDIVYQGSAKGTSTHLLQGSDFSGAAKRFAQAGFPLPSHDNPADHFLDTITPSFGSSEQKDLSKLMANPLKVSDDDLKIGADRALKRNNERSM